MRLNHPVTQREREYSSTDKLISTTTLKGVITSANRAFIDVSGFSEAELIGQAHNIVRHPEVPQAVFKGLWEKLKAGKPWLGMVKNRCKNGDHYYVDAYVTPIFDGDRMIGYQSVRTRPERSVIQRAEAAYRNLGKGKSRLLGSLLPSALSYRYKPWLFALPVMLPGLVAVALDVPQAGWVALASGVVAAVMGALMVAPLCALAGKTRSLADDALARQVYTGRGDEVGQLEMAVLMLRMQNRTMLGRVSHAADAVAEISQSTDRVVNRTTSGVRQQQLEVEQVATAMNQMTATVAEVARNAEETARASQQVLEQTADGTRQVEAAILDIENLSRVVGEASTVIERLQGESEQIGSVVDVISNIASETNLLALNAAIEAARAGDHGRGFAVVADEVRNLASNTQRSTAEIQQMIKAIQESSEQAVAAMMAGQKRAEGSVEVSRAVGRSFEAISSAVDHIADMNAQVATAADQQNQVSEEINRSISGITDIAGDTLQHADSTAEASRQLSEQVQRLQSLVRQFGAV